MTRLLLPALAVLALVLTAQATPAVHSGTISGVPGALHAFLLRANEPIVHDYSRTPSFTWLPVKQPGGHYQFQISTSQSFQDGTLVFKDMNVAQPAETVPRQLPWMTGEPYALWSRVRWISANGQSATQWSKLFGFNIQWAANEVPKQLPAPKGSCAGRRSTVRPRTRCCTPTWCRQRRSRRRRTSRTNASSSPSTTRSERRRSTGASGRFGMSGSSRARSNGLPAVSYGPWSPTFTTVNTPQTAGTLKPTDTVSDAWDKAGKAGSAHQLTPGFAWTPSAPVISEGIDPGSSLYRVYIFSDKNCVNRVFTGSIVGSPAWAPRSIGGPMPLPGDTDTLTKDRTAPPYLTGPGAEGSAVDATGATVVSNETAGSQVGSSGGGGSAGSAAPTGAAAIAGVDLWDSGWPSGRFYWTVVPVSVEYTKLPQVSTPSSSSSSSSSVVLVLVLLLVVLERRPRHLPRHGRAAGLLPVRSRHELRKGLAAGRHGLRHTLPLGCGPPAGPWPQRARRRRSSPPRSRPGSR